MRAFFYLLITCFCACFPLTAAPENLLNDSFMAGADITNLKVTETGHCDYLSALLLPEDINEVFLPKSLQITGRLYSPREGNISVFGSQRTVPSPQPQLKTPLNLVSER